MIESGDRKNVLILGGARSGKSYYAQEMAKLSGGKVLFVATATAGDEEMRDRIEKHKQSRPAAWRTLEVAVDIGKEIETAIKDEQVVIVDCITLLINNIFCRYEKSQLEKITAPEMEAEVESETGGLVACMQKVGASFIVVSNEVGLGIVPDNRLARLYRDILGRTNQKIAEKCDEVYMMVAGIPLRVK